jgi:replication factor C subunit 3/5
LIRQIQNDDFPHLLVYGPSGSGKRTRVQCILRELFGAGVDRLKMDTHQFQTPSGTKVDARLLTSAHHVEITPSDVGVHDRILVQELVRNAASSATIGEKMRFKVLLLSDADRLSRDAQHALRRTMEKYSSTCRLILMANSASRVLPAVRSRCLLLRVAAPSHSEIVTVLTSVGKKENYTVDRVILQRIAEASGRNLRRAILMLESSKVSIGSGSTKDVPLPQWYGFIQQLANKMLKQQTVRGLEEARNDFYELQAHLIPAELVLRVLLETMLPQLPDALKAPVVKLAATYEHKMRLGNKMIVHFEAFVANYMSLHKTYSESGKVPELEIY